MDDRKQSFVVDQQKFQQDNGTFDEAFADIVSSELAYDAATLKLYYPQYYKYFNPDIPLELSDNFESFFQNLDVNSEDNLLVPSYKNFVGMYLYFKTNNEKSETDVHPSIRAFDNVEKLFMSPAIREYLYYSIMKSNLEESINVTAELMSKYQEVQKNPEFFQEINNAYQQWSHLVKGNKSPSFNYPTIRNQKVSLESLAGKVVYIDVWATWCGPCLKELPHLEALQEKFKKSDKIAFVSISVDQDKAAWEIMVTQKNMKGIQLFADGNWASSIVQDFKINGIPRFIIIGKDGNIIDAKAIRPSAPEISQLLEKSIAE